MKKYINRNCIGHIRELLDNFPVVAILGPRQVGKTTLAKYLSSLSSKDTLYLDMENRGDNLKLDEPVLYLNSHKEKLVIIDEIHLKPEIFRDLRGIIDFYNVPGRFIILGSASGELLKQSSETLAGRVAYYELSPFNFKEVNDLQTLWWRGGFPLSYLAKNDKMSKTWLNNFIKTFLHIDIPMLGFNIPPKQLEQFWEMLAHLHGSLWNASLIGKNFGLTSPTIKRYLGLLESTHMVRALYPFSTNIKKRLVKTPKVYIRDSGILHALLRISDIDRLYSNPIVGMSYEGWVIEQICSACSDMELRPYFYKTHAGAEIDLVIDIGGELLAVEIKRSLSPKPERGFYEAVKDLNISKKYLIYPGKEKFVLKNNVHVLPINDFIEILGRV